MKIIMNIKRITPGALLNLLDALVYPPDYRLHRIAVQYEEGGGCAAHIYDGDKEVLELHASTEGNAVEMAKRWIDEQDELAPEFDLH
jgi:hypothetical protein